jgi:signal transduction histidine kinase
MTRLRYRQVFLFLVVLVLPTVAIIVQSRRNAAVERENAAQQRELAAKRKDDLRKLTAAEIGQDILARLERIKLQEIASARPGALQQTAVYSDPAVAFVGWEEGERLVWPWDALPNHPQSATPESPEFARKANEAARAEFAEKDYARAAALYREAIAIASTDTDRAAMRLALGNALVRSGAQKEGLDVYRDLLDMPSTITDDHGLSFASYAAIRLSEARFAESEVLDRIKRDVQPLAPVTPTQAYRLRSILEVLQNSKDAAVRDGASATGAQLAARLKDLEEAREVQENFQSLRVTAGGWQLHAGNDLWWIGRAPTGVSSKPLILAVRVEQIRESVEAERLARGAGPSFQIVANSNSGDPLNENLPDLRVVLGPQVSDAAVVAARGTQSFYGLSLFLVVMLTFVGAFFLWLDTRRESRIAELRSQFVSSVSHELKTPLTSIRMFAESLQMDDENDATDPQQRAEYLDTIVCETERLTRLLNNVLDFSRIERGQKNYHLLSEELPNVVAAAVRAMRFPLAEQGFDLKVDVCRDLPPLKVDRDAIEQAILNLLNNAMKYSGKSREIGLRLCRQNGSAVIQVSDHGIGIPASEQKRIFEKFYRVPSRENRAISGTGLGLSLVAHIAEAHGGDAEVESRVGTGSTFSIRLPLPSPGGSEEAAKRCTDANRTVGPTLEGIS